MNNTLYNQKIPFTQVANEVLNDAKLSFKAKGLFAYLYSKPNGWDFAARRIANDSTDGPKGINNALQELEQCGYLTREKQNDGRVKYNIRYKAKSPLGQSGSTKPEVPKGKQPKRLTAQRDAVSNKDIQVIKNINNKEIAEPSSAPFDWNKYLVDLENTGQRHLDVIAFYFRSKNLKFDTIEKAQAAIKRHLRAAKEVSHFSDNEIGKARDKARSEYPSYTIETILKVLTR